MAEDKKISQLSTSDPLDGSEVSVHVQSGESKKYSMSQVKDYILADEAVTLRYAQMYQQAPTDYVITAGLVDTYLGSVGAVAGASSGITVELFESIGGPGSLNPPQDSFVILATGVYLFNIAVSLTADTNNVTIDSAIMKDGVVEPGSEVQVVTDAQGTNRTFNLTKIIPCTAGEKVYLVGKADKACTVTIKSSMMNSHKIG